MMIADSRIVDPLTNFVLAVPGDVLSDDILYRLELVGVEMAHKAHAAKIWHEMVRGDISPVVAETRAAWVTGWPGYVRVCYGY